MAVSSVLVGDGGGTGAAAAIGFARLGLEVTLVERASRWPDEDLVDRMRALGIEPRLGVVPVGFVTVDRHVEVELSDGRIENYDVVVVLDAGRWRVIASGDAQASPAVTAVHAVVTALDASA